MADGEGLRIGGLVPFVAADAAIKDSRASADRRLVVSERIPRNTHTRGDVMQPVIGDASRHAAVSREQHPKRRRRDLGGLHARDKGRREVGRLDWGQLDVIPQSQIERESRDDAIVVLQEAREIPVA